MNGNAQCPPARPSSEAHFGGGAAKLAGINAFWIFNTMDTRLRLSQILWRRCPFSPYNGPCAKSSVVWSPA